MTDLAHIRPAVKKDLQSLRNMLPQLADFKVPDRRDPRDLWRGDLQLIETVLSGKAPDSFADVAVDGDDEVIGLILVTLRDQERLALACARTLDRIGIAVDVRLVD